ncbi:hypothetical protein [Bradyrhizobium sp. S3.5.5]|uniref:hypothetical protein n=1 Tax=Bradyrhizobium sp. S3.5.5 TaxID=3156430 RepID=UPI00339A2ADB
MNRPTKDLPEDGYALIIDGRVKTEFATREGVDAGARDLKQRFPVLQIRVYDARTKQHEEV